MHRPPCSWRHRRRPRTRRSRGLRPRTLEDRSAPLNSTCRTCRSQVNRPWPRLRHHHAPHCGSGSAGSGILGRQRLVHLFHHTYSFHFNRWRNLGRSYRGRCDFRCWRRGRHRGHWMRSMLHRSWCYCHRRWMCHRWVRRRWVRRRRRVGRCRRSNHHRRTRDHGSHGRLARNRWCGRHNRGTRSRLGYNPPRRRRFRNRFCCNGCAHRCGGPGWGNRCACHWRPRSHGRWTLRRTARLLLRQLPLQDQSHRIAWLRDVRKIECRLRFHGRFRRRRAAGLPAV
jgi:hypothetical protein